MTSSIIRPGLPRAYAFTVSQGECSAKLDQNELPHDVPEELKDSIVSAFKSTGWHRYTQPSRYHGAKEVVAKELGVDAKNLMITVGADQALEAAFMVCGGPGRTAQWCEPTYPYIANACQRTATGAKPLTRGRGVDDTPLDAYDLSCELSVIAWPNNPTGGLADQTVLEGLLNGGNAVLVDEAYADFSGHTMIAEVGKRDNLLIARSFSKSGLAAGHVGLLLGPDEAISVAETLYTAPYHLNLLQVIIAEHYPRIRQWSLSKAVLIQEQRALIQKELKARDLKPADSNTNFVMFDCKSSDIANRLYKSITQNGVRIRNLDKIPGLQGYLRVTVGTADENQAFLKALENSLESV